MNLIWALVILFNLSVFSKNISYETYIKETYKKCEIKTKNAFLTSGQVEIIKKKISDERQSSLVTYFDIRCKKRNLKLYLDTHLVRTLNETVLFEVKDNKISNVVVTNFMEPAEYKLPDSWMKQIIGKDKTAKLEISEDVDGLTGATLSSYAIVKATKKALLYHSIINEKSAAL